MKGRSTSLTSKILISLVLGIFAGIILHYLPAGVFKDTIVINGICRLGGQGFLRLMQMLVVPLVFASLVCGAATMGDTKSLGKVGVTALVFYLITTVIAIVLAILTAKVFNPGIGLNLTASQAIDTQAVTERPSFIDTLLNMIPTNPFNALAEGNMLPVIIFALLTGICIASLGEKTKSIATFFTDFNEIMMKMTMMIMKLAPIGVFCLITKTFSDIGFNAMVPLLKYIACVTVALAIHMCFVYQGMLKAITKLSPLTFLKKFASVISLAFSTATSSATIPLSIDTLEKMGVPRKISSFTIPLGTTINMDGTAIMQGVAVVFVAQAFGIELGLSGYLTVIITATLASIGTAGVPGSALIMLTMVFTSVGLPIEGISIIMGVDRIVDMCRTAVNVTGNGVCTTIIAHRQKEFDEEAFKTKSVSEI